MLYNRLEILTLMRCVKYYLSTSSPLPPPLNFERFNDKVRLVSDDEVSVGKHQFEYLFLVWQSGTVLYVNCACQ